MIKIDRVTKWFPTKEGRKYVFRDVSVKISDKCRLGVLGVNGAGKSTLLRMLGGAEPPNSGRISADGSISWPVGLAGGFQPNLTGQDNVRFVARVQGVSEQDLPALEELVLENSGLAKSDFVLPVKTYSSGMNARLKFGLSLAFDFDYYLIDEITSVGDAEFQRRSSKMFEEVIADRGLIFVSHVPAKVKQFCDSALLIADCKITHFDSIDEALETYDRFVAPSRVA